MFAAWPLATLITVLCLPVAVIVAAGPVLARCVDLISDRYAIGKTLAGAILLGATTSLPGIIASVSAALAERPVLAAANAVGGIAVQTAFLAVADLFYRRANLEHDAASIGNIVQGALLLLVLTVPLIAALCPIGAAWRVHPGTVVLTLVYLGGLHLVRRSGERPMWLPRGGSVETADAPGSDRLATAPGGAVFALTTGCAGAVAAAGWLLTAGAGAVADRLALDTASVGAFGIAVVTSTPELVTTVAAVRRGAVSIAIGGVMGGNAFDVLFLAAADVAYPAGSIYHHASDEVWFQLALACAMVALLVLGLALRQRRGPGNIGFESVAVLLVYLAGAAVMLGWPDG